jgi:hypothetical protein
MVCIRYDKSVYIKQVISRRGLMNARCFRGGTTVELSKQISHFFFLHKYYFYFPLMHGVSAIFIQSKLFLALRDEHEVLCIEIVVCS